MPDFDWCSPSTSRPLMSPFIQPRFPPKWGVISGLDMLRLLLLTALVIPMTAHAGDGHNCQRDAGQNMERKKQKC